MKSLLLFLCCLPFLVFSQESILRDEFTKKPISKAQVYDLNNQFVGLSNAKGRISVLESSYPITVVVTGYEEITFEGYQKEYILKTKPQDIADVEIKPIKKTDLYNRIIETSHQKLDQSSGSISGVYFESVMFIFEDTKDTVYMNNVCDLRLEKVPGKKSMDYRFLCANGSKFYSRTEMGGYRTKPIDTSRIEKILEKGTKFEDFLKYDLSNEKQYKLKYKEDEIKRIVDATPQQLVLRNDENTEIKLDFNASDVMLKYKSTYRSNKKYTGQSIFIDFPINDLSAEFKEEPYYLTSLISENVLRIFMDGKGGEVYILTGFVENGAMSNGEFKEFSKVKDYFKTLLITDSDNTFYQFELLK